jgi:hypothetical protein
MKRNDRQTRFYKGLGKRELESTKIIGIIGDSVFVIPQVELQTESLI